MERTGHNHGGEEAMGGLDGGGAGVEEHEAAGAVGVLGFQGLAPLPQHRRLLVPQASCAQPEKSSQQHTGIQETAFLLKFQSFISWC